MNIVQPLSPFTYNLERSLADSLLTSHVIVTSSSRDVDYFDRSIILGGY